MTDEHRSSVPLPPPPPQGIPPHRRLGQLRSERGLSQAQLAALAGIRKATLVSIERGQTQTPNQATLWRLATVFGLSLEEFRRLLGMHGPLYVPIRPADGTPTLRRWSPRAEQVAGWLDTLPIEEQELIERLCGYLHARRRVNLAADALTGECDA